MWNIEKDKFVDECHKMGGKPVFWEKPETACFFYEDVTTRPLDEDTLENFMSAKKLAQKTRDAGAVLFIEENNSKNAWGGNGVLEIITNQDGKAKVNISVGYNFEKLKKNPYFDPHDLELRVEETAEGLEEQLNDLDGVKDAECEYVTSPTGGYIMCNAEMSDMDEDTASYLSDILEDAVHFDYEERTNAVRGQVERWKESWEH